MNRASELAALFERFSPGDLATLDAWYCEEASFKDPFNEVRGIDAIRSVYAHMFETLEQPRFTVTGTTGDERSCWLAWHFRFGPSGKEYLVRGATHVTWAGDGRIQAHRDYWDPAEEIYEKVPLLGTLMRFIKGRLATPRK